MHYETFLFTRNQRQDFTAFVRPSLMSNKDISAIGAVFNYITDISRLTPEFPSLYAFPLGEYALLLRQYNSGRRHAGRAIAVIEGIAVQQAESSSFLAALPALVKQQAEVLNVSAAVADIEEASGETSAEHDWSGTAAHAESEPFIADFAERRSTDRLFLPFTNAGRTTLINVLADRGISPTPYFAFGTNSDVLAQLEQQARIDVVSFFKTDRASFRSRQSNRVTGFIGAEPEPETPVEPSMSLRPAAPSVTSLRPESDVDEENDVDTRVGSRAMSVRQPRREKDSAASARRSGFRDTDTDDEPTMLTMRQIRDQKRAEEAAAHPAAEAEHSANPIRRFIDFLASLVSPSKPE